MSGDTERLPPGQFIYGQRKIVERAQLKVCPACGAKLIDTQSWPDSERYLYDCSGKGISGHCGILCVFPAPAAEAVKHVTVNGAMPEEYKPEEWGVGRWDIYCPAVTWSTPPTPEAERTRRDGWNLPEREADRE